MIQLVTLPCMEPISVPGRQKTEGGGKEQHLVTVHSKSCLLLVGVLLLLLLEIGIAD